MKLRIKENIDNIMHVDVIKGDTQENLHEDQVLPDEIILPKTGIQII